MNQTSQQRELMVIAERVVRPIWADTDRKMKMRRELLSHLEEIYAEELQGKSPAEALRATADRFGPPDEVRGPLQQTVPRLERFGKSVDALFRRRNGESRLGWALRTGLCSGGIFFVYFMLAIGVLTLIQGRPLSDLLPGFFLFLSFCFGVNMGAIQGIGSATISSLLREPTRRSQQFLALMTGTLATMAVFVVTFTSLMAWGTRDPVLLTRIAVGSALAGLVMFPIVCLLLRYDRQRALPWEGLDIAHD